jgi:hypothetical protein
LLSRGGVRGTGGPAPAQLLRWATRPWASDAAGKPRASGPSLPGGKNGLLHERKLHGCVRQPLRTQDQPNPRVVRLSLLRRWRTRELASIYASARERCSALLPQTSRWISSVRQPSQLCATAHKMMDPTSLRQAPVGARIQHSPRGHPFDQLAISGCTLLCCLQTSLTLGPKQVAKCRHVASNALAWIAKFCRHRERVLGCSNGHWGLDGFIALHG